MFALVTAVLCKQSRLKEAVIWRMPINGNVKGATPQALAALQALARLYGGTITVGLGASSNLGGNHGYEKGRSDHDHGAAFDLNIQGMTNAQKLSLLNAAKQAGFYSFGLGSNIIHVGMHGAPRAWTYGGSGKKGIGGSNSIIPGMEWAGVSLAALKTDIISNRGKPISVKIVAGLPTLAAAPGALAYAQPTDRVSKAQVAAASMAAPQPDRTLRKGDQGMDCVFR